MSEEPSGRLYRFAPISRTGLVLGLSAVQCAALGAGVLFAGLLLRVTVHPAVVLVPIVASAAFAFAPAAGQPLHQWCPVVLRWAALRALRRTQQVVRAPWREFDPEADLGGYAPECAPPLAGLSIDGASVETSSPQRRMGLVRDDRERTVSATLRVQGHGFALRERKEQDRLLFAWGDALAGFCRERSAVSRVRWTEWAAPADLGAQRTHLDTHVRTTGRHDALASYRSLLEEAGPATRRHETLVTVTVDERRVRRTRNRSAGADEVLFEELRLLTARLEAADLDVSDPLSAESLASAIRTRLNPFAVAGMDGRRSLAELAGVEGRNSAGFAVDAEWSHAKADRAVHATCVVAQWPRLDVPANWMERLMLHPDGVRTISMLLEPVAPSRSRRQIDRDATRLATDEEQRNRTGFRVGARQRRAQADVASRETELVAGYPELEFVAVITVSAPDIAALEQDISSYENIAAECGLELRRLDGRHDLALVCSLPVGRGTAGRWLTW